MSKNLHANIWCVGRNYADHAQEMQAPVPTTPLFFLKAGSCLNHHSVIQLPTWSTEIHHEVEVAFLIDENLNFSHVTLALDLTARDAQSNAKKLGQPWTLAKSFTAACPIGSWIDLSEINDLSALTFELRINQNLRQKAQLSEAIFSPARLLTEAKKLFPLMAHDILLTGTPAGVGPLKPQDKVEAILSEQNRTLLTCFWDVLSIE